MKYFRGAIMHQSQRGLRLPHPETDILEHTEHREARGPVQDGSEAQ
ncbi:hypothetical protein M2267_001785 [Ensifer sp. KUDG1]